MFMRYRGGGVGHLYMRTIEVWLAETGWGSNDPLVSTDVDSSEEDSEDSDNSEDNGSGGNPEDGMPEFDTASNSTMDSDRGRDSEVDPDAEYASSEGDEETMDGRYGFSGL